MRGQFTCPKGHLFKMYRRRLGLGLGFESGLGSELGVGGGLASISESQFRTNDPSDR